MTPETTTVPEMSPPKSKLRPFPWLCPRCMQEQVSMAVIPYRGETRRDGQMVAVNIPALNIPMCANCGELLFTDKVDQEIRKALDDAAIQTSPGRSTATGASV